MDDKTRQVLTEEQTNQKQVPRLYANAIDKMIDLMPKNFTELQKARYLFINLGKLLAYDERFIVANNKAQRKLFKMAKEHVIEFNKIKEGAKYKGICLDLNRLYANVLLKAGIQRVYINFGRGLGIPHDSVTATLDGHTYCLDLQRDLIHIQLNKRTDFFGFQDDGEEYCDSILKDSEVEALDKSIEFTNYNYDGDKHVRKLRNKFEGMYFFDDITEEEKKEYEEFNSLPFKKRVEAMLKDISTIPGVKELAYTERTNVYCNMIKNGLLFGQKENFRIDNLYSVDEETKLPKEVIEVFTVVHMEDDKRRFARYIYDHVKKEYVEISNAKLLQRIEDEDLKAKKEITGMRRIRKEMKKETADEKRILSRLEENPMGECSQPFDRETKINVVDQINVVDDKLEIVPNSETNNKKPAKKAKTKAGDWLDL